MHPPHKYTGLLPIKVSIGGRKQKITMSVCDRLFRSRLPGQIETSIGHVDLDLHHGPQRLLGYAFENVLKHYRRSPLGEHIANVAKNSRGTFIDVGANLGMYSMLAKNLGMKSVAVEPEPTHGNFLQRNADLVGQVIAAAFSDQRGELPLYYEEGNPGATSLYQGEGSTKGHEVVPVLTFSDTVHRGDLGAASAIDLVKIDVEGFEEQAVRGMASFLEEGHRPDIWCEVRGDRSPRNGGSFRPVQAFLAEFGYTSNASLADRATRPAVHEELSRQSVFDMIFSVNANRLRN